MSRLSFTGRSSFKILILQLSISLIKCQGISLTTLDSITSTNVPATATPVPNYPYNFTLDTSSDVLYPWQMPMINENLEHWFDYFDNLTETGLSSYAKEYFNNNTLTLSEPFNSAEGVWAAFDKKYDNASWFCPVIRFERKYSVVKKVNLTFYIHGEASIFVRFGDFEENIISNELSLNWTSQTWDSELLEPVDWFELELHPNNETHPNNEAKPSFVLIDQVFVEVWGQPPPITSEPTTSELTTSEPKSTTEVDDDNSSVDSSTSTFDISSTVSETTEGNKSSSSGINLSNFLCLSAIFLYVMMHYA